MRLGTFSVEKKNNLKTAYSCDLPKMAVMDYQGLAGMDYMAWTGWHVLAGMDWQAWSGWHRLAGIEWLATIVSI